MRNLLDELIRLLELGRPCVFCQVVETRGSTPQKAGAAMLVFPDGSQSGTLGGGCIEAEVKRRALRIFHESDPKPEVMTFHLDGDYGWDDGLICGGRMAILADPLGQTGGYYREFRDLLASGRGCTEAVALPENPAGLPAGARALFDHAGAVVASTVTGPVPGSLAGSLVPLTDRPRAATRGGVAFLPRLPKVTLLIVGGGHVGLAVAELAVTVDFDVWVLDDRDSYASAERFPMARRRFVGDIGRTLREIAPELDPTVYCLIVTRGHNHDEEALYHLAPTPAGYVGMIGSKRKIRLIFDDLARKGIPQAALDRVHAPLGLRIGSQTVPEIAVSIVAELIATRNLNSAAAREDRREGGMV